MYQLIKLSIVAFLFSTCAGGDPISEGEDSGPFFNMTSYFQQQIDSLNALGISIDKTILLNGRTERHQLDDIDFAQELKLFQQSDINRPAWVDKYTAESYVLPNSNHQLTVYTATDSTLNVQSLSTVKEPSGEVKSIAVRRRTGSVLSKGTQNLVYEPQIGYQIKSSQSAKVGGEIDTEIKVSFVQE
ncbi:MAG: hypothetical protein AAFY36_07855 [Bacteroidota bacterium]